MAGQFVTQREIDEVGVLYQRLAPRLERIVRFDVRAPDAVIEDACQVAWTRLVDHGDRVRRETALPWLATTAVREACRLVRRAGREPSLDALTEVPRADRAASVVPGPDEVAEQHEQLASIRGLPARQQRLLWLQALGLNYVEMADHEGCTRRTVERQLLRAKHSIRRTCAPSTE
jgi:RNA polymerase sigma factor (sigma-70 family)